MSLQKKIQKISDPNYFSKRSLEIYRVLTSSLRLLPDFLVIGTQKGGTTSLYRYLEEHPCVAGAFAKEVHFFDNHTQDFKYSKGMSWYRSHFVYSAQKRYNQLVHQQTLMTGEGSPDYIFDPNAPQRIAAHLPNAKLIVLLRNPIDRAYSHYLHNARAPWDPGRETLSFEEAIAAEPERLQGELEKLLQDGSYFSYNYMHYSYLKRGLYAQQLQTWFKLFPREQLLILQSEDFFAEPDTTFQKVLNFLQLSPWQPQQYQLFNTRSENSASINAETRAKLQAYYQPHNAELYQLLNCDFAWS